VVSLPAAGPDIKGVCAVSRAPNTMAGIACRVLFGGRAGGLKEGVISAGSRLILICFQRLSNCAG